ncbi:hypothetical protein Syun_025598 [Stephania yunnanensis]|uniref:Beta-galactosidase beta-sandwich domain-containing protein n=1 Tax=Stephania yunnanensis TaxID=152371 RepID=A0AAP0EXH7_9MAGN
MLALNSELEKVSPSLGSSAVYLKESRINKLPRYDPTLKAVVVTCTEELAYQRAKEADNLLQKGVYLGTFCCLEKIDTLQVGMVGKLVEGLQDKIQLVPIDLWKRPAWYKEKVYPENKVTIYSYNGTASCFFSNANQTTNTTISFQDNQFTIPAGSVTILLDCKTETYYTAKAGFVKGSYVLVGLVKKTKQVRQEDPRWIIHSVNMGLALSLTSLVYYFRPLYDGFGVSTMWAVLTVVVVFEFTVGATLSKGLNIGFATFLVGGLGVGAHHLATFGFGDWEPILLGSFVFILVSNILRMPQLPQRSFSRFFPAIKARYDYGVLVFILTFGLVSVSGYRVDRIVELAHRDSSTILIGGLTCVLISVGVCPRSDEIVSKDDKYFLQRYKSVLNSKPSEESFANFASWEPGQGGFKFRHPWTQDCTTIGTLRRQCTCRIEALNRLHKLSNSGSIKLKCCILNLLANLGHSCLCSKPRLQRLHKKVQKRFKHMLDIGLLKPDVVEGTDVEVLNSMFHTSRRSPKVSINCRHLLHQKIRESYMHPQFMSDVMKPLQIEQLMDQEVVNLSGGELQRVALCLCLGKFLTLLISGLPNCSPGNMHYHWLLSSDGESEVLQSCVIVIIWSPYCSSYSDHSCWSFGDWRSLCFPCFTDLGIGQIFNPITPTKNWEALVSGERGQRERENEQRSAYARERAEGGDGSGEQHIEQRAESGGSVGERRDSRERGSEREERSEIGER